MNDADSDKPATKRDPFFWQIIVQVTLIGAIAGAQWAGDHLDDGALETLKLWNKS